MKKIITTTLFFITITRLLAQVMQMPLYEVFSSADCSNCAAANPILNNVFNQRPEKYISIKNQVGFPHLGDPYYNKENYTRLNYYNLNGVPQMAVNGIAKGDYSKFTTDLFDNYATETTPLEITATYTQTNERKFDVTVNLKSQTDLNGDLKLFVVLCEKKTVKNKMTNGETEFFHVAKKYINNNGVGGFTILNLIANTPVVYTAAFEVKGDYRLPANGLSNLIDWSKEHSIEDFNNLEIAVFLQDATSKKVYQAAYAKETPSGINELFENSRLTIYPNPSSGIVHIDFTLYKATTITVDVYNILGKYIKTIVKSSLQTGENSIGFDTATLTKGIYFIRISSDGFVITKKISVN